MNESRRSGPGHTAVADQAAAWILRRDRGLTAAEQDEFSEWLAADPRHGVELARHHRPWKRIDLLAQWRPEHSPKPNPDLLAPPLRRRLWRFAVIPVGLAAAAAGVALWLVRAPHRPPAAPSAVVVALPPGGNQILEDGSVVELNLNSKIAATFSATERRVELLQGEAHFTVAKNRARPFIVSAGGVEVRAVGTAFNVRMGAAALEVLVTEGHVQVSAPQPVAAEATAARTVVEATPVLAARQRAFVPLEAKAGPPQIATLTVGEIERVLAWQQLQMDFTAAPLGAIAAEFNRRNVVQLVIADPELASLRLSATFRSDNLDGFVSLLEAGFGVRAERRGDAEIVLFKLHQR